jgi:hypothetical protein
MKWGVGVVGGGVGGSTYAFHKLCGGSCVRCLPLHIKNRFLMTSGAGGGGDVRSKVKIIEIDTIE